MRQINPDYFTPHNLADIIGQQHLIGEGKFLSTLVKAQSFTSLVFTGAPGIGKTSLVKVLAELYQKHILWIHASIDSKQKLVDAIKTIQLDPASYWLVIEEIHRLHRDKQDVLLNYLEQNNHFLCATTTSDPYYVLNKAVLSRVNVVKMKSLTQHDISVKLSKWYEYLEKEQVVTEGDKEALDKLVFYSNADLRKTLQWFCLLINSHQTITNEIVTQFCEGVTNHQTASIKASVYDLKSSLQKAIRGSDVDAALLYAAGLLLQDELRELCRRLVIIAHEDVGLAHPNLCHRTIHATEVAQQIGMPECRIIIANLVVELCLSIKSNSAYEAMNKACELWQNSTVIRVPFYLQANPPPNVNYLYPHDYPNHWVKQNYWPINITKTVLYKPQTNSYFETNMNEKHQAIIKS